MMVVRPFPRSPRPNICQICELLSARQSFGTRQTFLASRASQKRVNILQDGPYATAVRPFTTSRPSLKAKRANAVGDQIPRSQATRPHYGPELTELVAAVDQIKNDFLAQSGIPSEDATIETLRAIERRDFKIILDADSQLQLTDRDGQSRTTAADLLSLDANGTGSGKGASSQPLPLQLQNVVDHISDAAYAIVVHPTVFISPRVLEEYVNIQARLGKPETLPAVLSLYASKPLPRLISGSVQFVPQNPGRAANAVDAKVAEVALDAAIEAKNLDAAVGIVENSYASKATVRAKLVRKALMPAAALAAAPVGVYALASNFSHHLQDTMDPTTATHLAFAGILAYVGFTATLGVVVVTTANDQMRRVSWAPGTPLRQRWIREEERAALDKIACSFGFSEQTRYGEEEGAEFQALREFILRKGMILDAAELMEGMS